MIIKRTDGSFVIEKNGYPYHVPDEGAFAAEWAEVNAYAAAHPDEVEIDAAPPVPSLDELKAAKRAEIWGAGDAILAQVKNNFTAAEIEAWPKQEQGAKDIQAGNTDTEAALFVAAIASRRGIETTALVSKILANVASYGALSALVIGEQQRLDDMIKTATAREQLDAIVWTLDPLAGE